MCPIDLYLPTVDPLLDPAQILGASVSRAAPSNTEPAGNTATPPGPIAYGAAFSPIVYVGPAAHLLRHDVSNNDIFNHGGDVP